MLNSWNWSYHLLPRTVMCVLDKRGEVHLFICIVIFFSFGFVYDHTLHFIGIVVLCTDLIIE